MPRSQLKQLKASLREHGVLGPQKSKKQRKQISKDGQKRAERNAALEKIREQFNPFEIRTSARRPKYDVVSNKEGKTLLGRPGVTRGLGEERRRQTLLRELQSKNKVGGLLDRRFGEDDPTLTPEQKAAERYARQNERKMRKSSLFNLEMDSGDEMTLTHGGRSLDFDDGGARDDYEDDNDVGEEGDDLEAGKGRTPLDIGEAEDGVDVAQHKKSKKEVMKEVIAKSKQHKADRQAAKEDDDDLRIKLDKGLPELFAAIHSHNPPEKPPVSAPSDNEPHMDPARAAMLAGKSREDAEKEYEANIRQMKLDARSQPSFRTKTEEEKAAEQAETLKELERKRIRRMKGDAESSDEEEEPQKESDSDQEVDDDAEAFGLRPPETVEKPRELEVEDEDEFVLDDDLIASESDADAASEQDLDSDQDSSEPEDDGDDDFINGLVLPRAPSAIEKPKKEQPTNPDLAYTYPCPQSHAEFLELVKDKKASDLSTIVQRIRALYHKGLAQENSAKLAQFAQVLLEHIYYRAQKVGPEGSAESAATEALMRHLHSMAKAQPLEVGNAFRSHLSKISEERPLELNTGDCIVLTAVGTIFPTSDHFHAIATPAMLTIGRYLGQSSVRNLQDLGIGAYCCTLALQYQSLSKRYFPEVINYIVNGIAILAPKPMPASHLLQSAEAQQPLNVPLRLPDPPLRIISSRKVQDAPDATSKFSWHSLVETSSLSLSQALALLHTFIRLGSAASTLWASKTAYPELMAPLIHALQHLTTLNAHLPPCSITLATTVLSDVTSRVSESITSRRPLLLHNHRPLPIPTSYPLFIDNYNPDRHYDPDRERAELSKLRAEHRKERKGAMRELRKDANFIAREKLREKKEKDEAYEKKFKRLVAEIQGEEGREAKEYEREKKKRKGRF